MKKSLSRQLLVTIGSIYLLGSILFAWIIGYTQSEKILNSETENARLYVNSISSTIKFSLEKKNISAIENTLTEYMKLKQFIEITIVSPDNTIITQLRHTENGIQNTFQYGSEYVAPEIKNIYQQLIKMDIVQSTVQLGTIFVLVNHDQVRGLKYDLWITVAGSGLIVFILILTVMVFQLKVMLSPLYQVSEFTRNFMINLGKKLPVTTEITEINDLIQAVNWSSVKLKEQTDKIQQVSQSLDEKVRKRTKELELAKEFAESASAEKTRFLSHMSHELRTPLNSILGFSQLLLLKADKLTPSQLDNIKEINRSGNHLLSLVNEVLDISKIEEGELQIEPVVINVNVFFTDFYGSIKKMATRQELDIELLCHVPNDLHMSVDAKRLTQIMYNLVSNAIKYTHKGGNITVKIKQVNDLIRVEIIDTGIGIEEKDFPKVFDKFSRFNVSHADGAGIGLHLTKELVEMMDGTTGFTSTYGEGTTFWFELPKNYSD